MDIRIDFVLNLWDPLLVETTEMAVDSLYDFLVSWVLFEAGQAIEIVTIDCLNRENWLLSRKILFVVDS